VLSWLVAHHSLQEYYAQPAGSVVGSTQQTVAFQRLLGEFHWKRKFAQLYKEQHGQWLTPTEVFRPFYSHVMARFMAQHVNHEDPLTIIELGGGRGTNALCIMDFLEQTYPQLYDRTSYTIYDASPTLLDLQRETLAASSHGAKVQCCDRDLVEISEGREKLVVDDDTAKNLAGNQQYFVLGFELLDNLPHDKLRIRNTKLEQAELVPFLDETDETEDGGEEEQMHYKEVFHPLSDPLLMQIVQSTPAYKRFRRAAWIPTTACGLLQQIQRQLPQCQVVLADFDWLPPSDALMVDALSLQADGQPLVTDMNDVDLACYLQPTETPTDILFPTSFTKLSWYAETLFSNVAVQKQADFLRSFGPDEVAATSSFLTGYSPLVHDFGNCSVLTITNENNNNNNSGSSYNEAPQ